MEQIKNTCCTCGTQYKAALSSPEFCPVCNDDRQYLTEDGQSWTNSAEILANHQVLITELRPTLFSLQVTPLFALGNRALLTLSPGGNILWDCIPLINEPVAEFIKSKGGLKAIVFSHPHYYSTMNVWAEQFDCPVYIHRDDEHWIKNWGPHVQLWAGPERDFWDGIKAVHVGGHFPGSAVLQVPSLSPGGALMVGDTLLIALSKRHMAIMHSYPNQVLLPREVFAAALERMKGLRFDTMYGAFAWQTLQGNAMEVFKESMNRYVKAYGL